MSVIKKVIVNTGFQYARMIISILISLYSVRLVLAALGIEDYGIYSLMAGIVATLSFLNGSMTVSSQRYLSFYIGKANIIKLKQTFQTSVLLHLLIGIAIVIILEFLGLYLFTGFLNVNPDRILVAKIVFHCMVVSTFFTINAVPYDSAINAHEDLIFDAIIGILDSVLKLGIAIWLLYYKQDRLILFGIALAVETIIIRLIKSYFCYRKYEECTISSTSINFALFREMFSFAGWNTFGAASAIVRSQGLAVVLNLFYGATINAAYGIASQINWQLRSFSLNMLKALRPQIIQSEGRGNRDQMLRLSFSACKFGFFLMAFFSLPLIFEANLILTLWLKEIPENSIIFTRLIVILALTNMITIGLQTALQATGKIKSYQIVVSLTILLNLPISWGLLHLGFKPYSVILNAIILEIIASILRIIYAKKQVNMAISDFFRDVLYGITIPLLITLFFMFSIKILLDESILRLIIITSICGISLITSIYYFGISKYERHSINILLNNIRNKLLT